MMSDLFEKQWEIINLLLVIIMESLVNSSYFSANNLFTFKIMSEL